MPGLVGGRPEGLGVKKPGFDWPGLDRLGVDMPGFDTLVDSPELRPKEDPIVTA